MKILVTGAAGFIGSVVTEALLEAGHDVVALDNLENGHREAVDQRARFIEADILRREQLIALLDEVRPDAVFHLAAEALIGVSMVDPGRAFHKNVAGSINLVDAMLRADVRTIVFSSTAAVYGDPEAIPITEQHRLVPTNAYGESKLAFERMLRWYGQAQGLRHVTLRYFNACGATERCGEDRPNENHLIPLALFAAMRLRDSLSVFGDDYPTPDGTCVRDYVHVKDIAQGHLCALERAAELTGRAFNLGSGSGHSILDVIASVQRVTGLRVPHGFIERRAGDPPSLVASNEDAVRLLGWRPQYTSLDEMVADAYSWRQRHPDGYASQTGGAS